MRTLMGSAFSAEHFRSLSVKCRCPAKGVATTVSQSLGDHRCNSMATIVIEMKSESNYQLQFYYVTT